MYPPNNCFEGRQNECGVASLSNRVASSVNAATASKLDLSHSFWQLYLGGFTLTESFRTKIKHYTFPTKSDGVQ